ncbi:hypothetical protein AB4Z21_08650, partial [Paenibacillus sp. MCAF20]
ESIRKLFEIVLGKPEDESDDLVGPIELYATYTKMFEELDANNDQLLDISCSEKPFTSLPLINFSIIGGRSVARKAGNVVPFSRSYRCDFAQALCST